MFHVSAACLACGKRPNTSIWCNETPLYLPLRLFPLASIFSSIIQGYNREEQLCYVLMPLRLTKGLKTKNKAFRKPSRHLKHFLYSGADDEQRQSTWAMSSFEMLLVSLAIRCPWFKVTEVGAARGARSNYTLPLSYSWSNAFESASDARVASTQVQGTRKRVTHESTRSCYRCEKGKHRTLNRIARKKEIKKREVQRMTCG